MRSTDGNGAARGTLDSRLAQDVRTKHDQFELAFEIALRDGHFDGLNTAADELMRAVARVLLEIGRPSPEPEDEAPP
jgi:hypothetical protein